MPGPVRQVTMPHSALRRLVVALLITTLALWTPPTLLHAAEAAMTVQLPASKWKAVRLRNLPKDAVIAVAVQSEGKITVILLNEQDYRHFRADRRISEPVFAGSVARTLSFTVTMPASGNYYLVLDNRGSGEARKVKFLIRAQRGRSSPPTDKDPAPGDAEPDKM